MICRQVLAQLPVPNFQPTQDQEDARCHGCQRRSLQANLRRHRAIEAWSLSLQAYPASVAIATGRCEMSWLSTTQSPCESMVELGDALDPWSLHMLSLAFRPSTRRADRGVPCLLFSFVEEAVAPLKCFESLRYGPCSRQCKRATLTIRPLDEWRGRAMQRSAQGTWKWQQPYQRGNISCGAECTKAAHPCARF